MVQFDHAKNLTWARTAGQRPWKHGYSARGSSRGAAWLSSARVVRCWVKSRNERNPCPVLLTERCTLRRPPAISWRKVGMTSSHHGLYVQGYTCYNGRYKPPQTREGEQIGKNRSQFGLQAATRLHEAGIASNGASERRREYVPGPCTHRPSHHESGLY